MGRDEIAASIAGVVLAAIVGLTTCAVSGCGASALEAHATTIAALNAGSDVAETAVKDLAAPRYQSCRDTWADSPDSLEVCVGHVTAEYMPAAFSVDAVKHAIGLYATAVLASETGQIADLVTLARKAWEAYRAMVRALAEIGVRLEQPS